MPAYTFPRVARRPFVRVNVALCTCCGRPHIPLFVDVGACAHCYEEP